MPTLTAEAKTIKANAVEVSFYVDGAHVIDKWISYGHFAKGAARAQNEGLETMVDVLSGEMMPPIMFLFNNRSANALEMSEQIKTISVNF